MNPNHQESLEALLTAAEELLEARANQMVTVVEWRALEKAVRAARVAQRPATVPKEPRRSP